MLMQVHRTTYPASQGNNTLHCSTGKQPKGINKRAHVASCCCWLASMQQQQQAEAATHQLLANFHQP
jgi:hypothetical protein